MESVLRIVGHGPLRRCSRCLNLSEPATLADVLDWLQICGELRESVVALKDHRLLSSCDQISAGDVIDLFVLLCGG